MSLPILEPDQPKAECFTLEMLTEGVYAAISRNRGAASNSAIVDLGDALLVFDTFMTPYAADELRAAAEKLFRAPVKYVVNSHWHADHVLGNDTFPQDALLISTSQTRDLIAAHIPGRIRALRQQKPQMEQDLRALQETLSQASDAQARARLHDDIRLHQIMLDAASRARLRLPDWTFEQQLVLHGQTRSVEILTLGGGHTASDAVLLLREEGILFTADLLFNGMHPWMGDGDPAEWARIVGELEALNTPVVIPGHGPTTTPAVFGPFRQYIEAVEQIVRETADAAPPDADLEALAAGIPVPEVFQHLAGEERFPRNIAALVARSRPPGRPRSAGASQG